jgi:hypothetical protein
MKYHIVKNLLFRTFFNALESNKSNFMVSKTHTNNNQLEVFLYKIALL